MTPVPQIALALGSVVVLLGLMGLVRHFAERWSIGAEVQRKLVHIGTGLYALVLPWLFPNRWPVYFLIVLTLGVMLVLRMPKSRLGSTLHGVERQSYGDLLLAVSVGLCLFLAQDQLYLYVLPIAVLTLADAAAALAGSTYGTRFFRVEDGRKSVEGSAVFFAVTLLISVICLMLMTTFPPLNILVLSLMVAGFGTLVEAVSWRGFDNMFLPLGLLIFLAVHAGDSLPELLSLAAFFSGCVIVFKVISPKIGLSEHAARVYVITVFLLLAVTEVQNAVFPILVLAAHAWARTVAPSNSKFPDLDIVAGLALISFGWLTLGNATGLNAVAFYGITAMGMLLALCAIALQAQARLARAGVLVLLLLGASALRASLMAMNPAGSNWNGPMWIVVASSLALAVLVPLVFPQAFGRMRVARVAGLAVVVPLLAYGDAVCRLWGYW